MKKQIILASSLFLGIGLLIGCSTAPPVPNTVDVVQLVDAMVEKGYVQMPMQIDETLAEERYLIDPENVEKYAIAKTDRSPGIGLIIMAEAKEGKEGEVQAAMEQVLANEVGNAFYPDEKEAAEQAEILVDGPYVSLFILNPEIEDEALLMYKDALEQ